MLRGHQGSRVAFDYVFASKEQISEYPLQAPGALDDSCGTRGTAQVATRRLKK